MPSLCNLPGLLSPPPRIFQSQQAHNYPLSSACPPVPRPATPPGRRAVVDGEMAFVRLGTCGALQPPARLGSLVVSDPGAILIRRNPDAFGAEGEALGLPPYTFSQPIPSDPVLSLALQLEAARLLGPEGVCSGLNATADSFYCSQGRWAAVHGPRRLGCWAGALHAAGCPQGASRRCRPSGSSTFPA